MAEPNHGLTWEQHQALGQELRQMGDRLQALPGVLAGAYGAGSAPDAAAVGARDAVDALRADLDAVLARDFREQPAEARHACYAAPTGPEPTAPPVPRKPLWAAPLDEATTVVNEDKRWGGEGG